MATLQDASQSVHLQASGDGATVFDDDAVDRLTGASGWDWLFAEVGKDVTTGVNKADFLNDATSPSGGGHGKPK